MKVLMIEFFYPENTYTLELGRALAKHVDLTVACKRGVILPDQDDIVWKGILYEGGHNKVIGLFKYMKCMLRVAWEIRTGHYDVVNIQYMRKARFEIPVFYMMRKHYKVLADTIHTIVPHEAKSSDHMLFKKFYRKCDLLIVHNHQVKKQLIREYGVAERKICVMPHGIYTLPESLKAGRSRVPDGKTHFLMFGQLRKYKGIDVLLKALSHIPASRRISIHVTIAGPQYPKLDSTDYEAMARRYRVDDCVTFIRRHIPVEEHEALFADADICLFPYKELYGSGALMMAYSYVKPVITTDDPIFCEETDHGKTGLLFRKNDPKAMAEAMVRSLAWSEADYESFRQHIRQLNEKKYNWDASALILKRSYEEVLKH